MKAIELLNRHNLSVTKPRVSILNALLESEVGLSEKEINSKIDYPCNRATIYRTLNVLKEKDLIHPVVTEENLTRYLIRKDPRDHLHFKCDACGDITCMTSIALDDIPLPNGFTKRESSFIISGTCSKCNNY